MTDRTRKGSDDPEPSIGAKLRHMFDEIVNEPVPNEFLDILRRADDKEKSGGLG